MSQQLDVITLRGLTADGIHGVFEFERRQPQPFIVDVVLWVASDTFDGSDNIEDTISYADVAQSVSQVLTGPPVRLLETLGHRIATSLMAYERVRAVEVTVHKPNAPLPQAFTDVAVTVRRGASWAETNGLDEPFMLTAANEADTGKSHDDTPVDAPGREKQADVPFKDVKLNEDGVLEEDDHEGTVIPQSFTSVNSELPWKNVVLAIGGNVGNVPATLASAVSDLIDVKGIRVVEVSPILRTRSVLRPEQAPQADYWNAVILARTVLTPNELLGVTQEIEHLHGRERVEKWGPRTLDIDIIQYEGVSQITPELTLPHPHVRQRAFVLAPWLLADPQAVLTGKGKVQDLLELTPDREGIIDAVTDWLEDSDSLQAESDAVLAGQYEANESTPAEVHTDNTQTGVHIRDAADETSVPRVLQTYPDSLTIPQMPNAGRKNARSRLDMVPELSKAGLAPSSDGDDVVWRRLWEQWGATSALDSIDAQEKLPAPSGIHKASQVKPSPLVSDISTLQWDSPALAPAEDVASEPLRETQRETTKSTSLSVERNNDAEASTANEMANESAAETRGAREQQVRLRKDAGKVPLNETPAEPIRELGQLAAQQESAPARQKPMSWSQVLANSRQMKTQQDAPSQGQSAAQHDTRSDRKPSADGKIRWKPRFAETQEQQAEAEPRQLNLPEWDFSHRQVRIFDDAESANTHPTVASTNGGAASPSDTASHTSDDGEGLSAPGVSRVRETQAVRRRSILEANLPEGTPIGPLSNDETTKTGIMRRVVIRPSGTGQIPISRREDSLS